MSAYLTPTYLAPCPIAAEAITRGQAVVFNGSQVEVAGAGARAIGVAQETVTAGQPVSIAVSGGGGVGIAGGTITAGASLTTDANGHYVATTTADAIITAIADEAAVDNDVFALRPTHPIKY